MTVRIERILFDQLRTELAARGLHEGDAVTCSQAFQTSLHLRLDEHRTLLIHRDAARFIAVRGLEP